MSSWCFLTTRFLGQVERWAQRSIARATSKDGRLTSCQELAERTRHSFMGGLPCLNPVACTKSNALGWFWYPQKALGVAMLSLSSLHYFVFCSANLCQLFPFHPKPTPRSFSTLDSSLALLPWPPCPPLALHKYSASYKLTSSDHKISQVLSVSQSSVLISLMT